MERTASVALDAWLTGPRRKPLVLRGARQVGKTWLVRDLARRHGRDLVEIDFERDPGLRKHFAGNDPRAIVAELALALGRDLPAGRVVLFLDEIQAAGEVLDKLRWFAEELPELPVVAAGSLLELTLSDHRHSMPVGRITYQHIEPMGFGEFLRAHGQDRLAAVLDAFRPGATLSPAAHDKASAWFSRFAMVGGMPGVVAEDVAGAEPGRVRRVQKDLIAAFRDDFSKYGDRLDRSVLDGLLHAVAAALGGKFVYARVGEGVKQHQARRALELLADARLCSLVRWSAANGVPLGGQVKDTFRKVVLLDVGLLHALLGTPAGATFPSADTLAPAVRGQMAEQLAGQALRLASARVAAAPELYYWQREGGRPGEIDYLVQAGTRIVPVELKAGAAGSMKSLHQFMHDKKLDLAARLDANPPSEQALDVHTTQSDHVRYRLVGLPAYLAERLLELLAEGGAHGPKGASKAAPPRAAGAR